jgi:hypothetical protein
VPLISRELDNALFMPPCPSLEGQNEKNETLDLQYGVKVNVSRYDSDDTLRTSSFDVMSSRRGRFDNSITLISYKLPLQTIPHLQLSITNRLNTVKNERRPDHRRTVSHLFSMLFVSVVKDES